MPTKLFENDILTEGEQTFVDNVLLDDKSGQSGTIYYQKAQALATLKLAKQIEKSTISSNKSSFAMNLLTGALVFVGICQVVVAIIAALNK